MSGLAAALDLIASGHDVTVIEARTRPGGRVFTIREPFADGLYGEAGAVFVSDSHDLTIAYCKRFGLSLTPEQWNRDLTYYWYTGGRRVRIQDLPTGLGKKYVRPLETTAGDPLSPSWPTPQIAEYDKLSWAALLRKQGATETELHQLGMGYAGLLGEGIDSYSALSWLRGAALDAKATALYRIQGGTDRLPEAMAKALSHRIRYGVIARRLEQDRHGVRVYCQTPTGTSSRLTGDRLVCTLSFSVLRGIEVEPAFSVGKQRAIAKLPYTSVARVFVQMRERFWLTRKQAGSASTDLPIQEIYDDTVTQAGQRGILSSYCVGERARAMSKLDEPGRLSTTIRDMTRCTREFRGTRRAAHRSIGTTIHGPEATTASSRLDS